MLTSVEIFNPFVTSAPLPISDDELSDDPIQIHNVDGLGPVAAEITSVDYGGIDGQYLTGMSVGKRNIVVTVGFNPNWVDQSIESLRQMLYKYFMPKSSVRLEFESTHIPKVQISGVVESCTPNIFSKDPEMDISIICVDPNFKSIQPTSMNYVTTSLDSDLQVTIDYEGTVPTGFNLDITVPTAMSPYMHEIRISEAAPSEAVLQITPSISDTNMLQINTVPGSKYVKTIDLLTGSATSALGALNPNSTWPILAPGDKVLWTMSVIPGLNWSLSYNARYGGL